MTKENFDELRMEIHSWFVKKHEYWIKRKRGKNWIARITGLDERYGFKREFLEPVRMGKEKVFRLEDFHIGAVYEVASVYCPGKSEHISIRDTYECTEITETHVVLQCVTQDEVIRKFSKGNKSTVAKNLVQQLLEVVTKEEAVNLIQLHK